MRKPRVILEGYSYLEAPRWHEGRLWLSDFYTHRVLSVRSDGSDVRVEAEVEGQPSGLGWLPDGRLLVVSMCDQRLLRRETDGMLVEHADLSAYATGHLNDMLVDGSGRAYVGNFGYALMSGDELRAADVVRVDPDGVTAVAARALYFPNGTVLIDGELIIAETFGDRLSSFELGPPTASAVMPRVLSGRPTPWAIARYGSSEAGRSLMTSPRARACTHARWAATRDAPCTCAPRRGSPSTSAGTRARRGSWPSRSKCLPDGS